jgi:hypothetical protein
MVVSGRAVFVEWNMTFLMAGKVLAADTPSKARIIVDASVTDRASGNL